MLGCRPNARHALDLDTPIALQAGFNSLGNLVQRSFHGSHSIADQIHRGDESAGPTAQLPSRPAAYNYSMERKIFWMIFTVLGLLADFLLPIWWGLAATIPILFVSWWVAYRSDWF